MAFLALLQPTAVSVTGADDLTALGVVVEDIQYVVGGSQEDTQVTQVRASGSGRRLRIKAGESGGSESS